MSENNFADVLWWNGKRVCVRCPFCKKSHEHRIVPEENYWSENDRVPHCDTLARYRLSAEYRICFPFDVSKKRVAYEIDKDKKRFVTVGIEQDDEDVSSLMADLESDLRLEEDNEPYVSFEDGRENTIIPYTNRHGQDDPVVTKSILLAISNCVTREVEAVRRFLSESADAEIFIKGKDRKGSTALLMAAAEDCSEMVLLLLESRSDVNSHDKRGRTPLMEAALWGRAENVKILLRYGGDRTVRDRKGHIAFDFAISHPRNTEERRDRAGGVYKEDFHEAEAQRRAIEIMLDMQPPKSTISLHSGHPTDLAFHSFHKSQATSSIVFTAPVANFDIPTAQKTIGVLVRGKPFDSISAMSGWTHNGEGSVIVSGRSWMQEVFRICEVIGYNLPKNHHDQGRDGSFNACHAEKQLIAFFLSKHCFYGEMITDPEDRPLWDLYHAQPPVSLQRATILTSTVVCNDCSAFARRVENTFKLTLHLEYREGNMRT